MTKYVACFFVIISLLGQSLLLSASAEPMLGPSTEISTMTQKLSTHISVIYEQATANKNAVIGSHDTANTDKAVTEYFVKNNDFSKCEKTIDKCVQIDSGHCSAHSYCHSGALLPMTMVILYLPFSSKFMTTAWSSKTIQSIQDIRPPIA
ncbi:hypothetical protein [Shewanella surugensis]|uniref:Uncharacterized protein n=1 Tax=Shewanella surugensis TaxID=212020 RepID=A0ABT0LFP4_9GAMM|nr:hypothetical protein [Shewanella surugensis]MCL1126529.1 hypothetical protein [Shewanella surugensis]